MPDHRLNRTRTAYSPIEQPDVDYVTINPAVAHGLFNVVVMKAARGDYTMFRCSRPLLESDAKALARSWAAAMQLEIR